MQPGGAALETVSGAVAEPLMPAGHIGKVRNDSKPMRIGNRPRVETDLTGAMEGAGGNIFSHCPWHPGDLDALVPRLRTTDVNGIQAAQGIDPRTAIELSVASSVRSWAFIVNSTVEAVGGIARWPKEDGVGVPWLLGTPVLEQYPRQMLHEGRRWVAQLHARYHTLFNFVDCRNRRSIIWLTHLGFTIARIVPAYGVARIPFAQVVSSRLRRVQPGLESKPTRARIIRSNSYHGA